MSEIAAPEESHLSGKAHCLLLQKFAILESSTSTVSEAVPALDESEL